MKMFTLVKRANIVSIDQEIYKNMMMNGAEVLAVYSSTIHLSLYEDILTLGYSIGNGKHHIVIDQLMDFLTLDLYPCQKVSLSNHQLMIGQHIFEISSDVINRFYPYEKKFEMNDSYKDTIDTLKDFIMNNHHINLFNYDQKDPVLKYQFDKINNFLSHQTHENAKSILGLGMGLTPLGDDILTGYVLAHRAIDKNILWINQIIEEASIKTSKLSYQNLVDTNLKYYPDSYIQLVEDFFNHRSIESAKAILKHGATSGAGILTGFIYGLL